METQPVTVTRQVIYLADETEASQPLIGTSTALDYNLASIHKNAIIVTDSLVYLQGVEFPPETVEAVCSGRL